MCLLIGRLCGKHTTYFRNDWIFASACVCVCVLPSQNLRFPDMFGSSTSSPHIIGVVGRRGGWRWWHKPKCKPPRAAGKRSAYCNSVCSNPVHFSPERPIWRLNVIFFFGCRVVVVKLRAETTHAQYCRINCGSALFLFTPNIWSRKCAQSRESSREKRIMRIYRFFFLTICVCRCVNRFMIYGLGVLGRLSQHLENESKQSMV